MKITVLGFGIVKDIFKSKATEIELPKNSTVADIKRHLETQFPQLKELASYMIAVNDEYASFHNIIKPGDEVAIVPPVSGG